MNKKELIRHVSDLLRENNVRKPISIPKHVFHISDDEGNKKDFTVKKTDKSSIYTIEDVGAILDACLCVIQDALKHGEPIAIHGFGTLDIRYRKPRKTKHFETGEDIVVKGRYVPKFSFGNDLRLCARVYEMSLGDKFPEPVPFDDDEYEKDDE